MLAKIIKSFCKRKSSGLMRRTFAWWKLLLFDVLRWRASMNSETHINCLTDPWWYFKEKILKPWNGVLCIHFSVCLCVCSRATEHTCWPWNLIFGLNDPWDMKKKLFLLMFEIFIFTLFIGIFQLCPYIALLHFGFPATGHSYSHRDVIFGLRVERTLYH